MPLRDHVRDFTSEQEVRRCAASTCVGFHVGTFRREIPYVLWRTGIIVEDEDRDNRFMGGSRSCATEGGGRDGARPSRGGRCGRGVPRTSRPTMWCGQGPAPWVRGRGRRPRRPACLWAFSWASPLARRAEDVAPYHVVRTGAGTMGTWQGPTSSAARVHVGVLVGVPVGAARTSHPTMWCGQGPAPWVRGRDRRPRRPACLWASPWALCGGRTRRRASLPGWVRRTGRSWGCA